MTNERSGRGVPQMGSEAKLASSALVETSRDRVVRAGLVEGREGGARRQGGVVALARYRDVRLHALRDPQRGALVGVVPGLESLDVVVSERGEGATGDEQPDPRAAVCISSIGASR